MPPAGAYPLDFESQWFAPNMTGNADGNALTVYVTYSMRDYNRPSTLGSLDVYHTTGTAPNFTFPGPTNNTHYMGGRRTIASCIVEYGKPVSGSPYDHHFCFAQNGTDGYNFLFTDGSVEHLPLASIYRLWPDYDAAGAIIPKSSHPNSNHIGREHFANADYLFGISDDKSAQ